MCVEHWEAFAPDELDDACVCVWGGLMSVFTKPRKFVLTPVGHMRVGRYCKQLALLMLRQGGLKGRDGRTGRGYLVCVY